MRLIGRLNSETNARTFGDYLTSLEIRNAVEAEPDGGWAVWVFSEDQLETSHQALTGYLANPKDSKYQRASEKAGVMREREQKEKAKFAKRVVTRESLWPGFALGPLTLALMGACIGLALVAGFPPAMDYLKDEPYYRNLYFSLVGSEFMPEIRHGQIWRLLTPIFIHMNLMHLLFNMLCLKDFGSMVESRQGSFKLFLLVLVIGVGSNFGQALIVGPDFGGMSGVLYGLFGYIWMQGKFQPASGLRLDPTTVVMMVAWFFLCLFHIIANVANVVHGVGLVMGMIWGAGPPLTRQFIRKQ